MNFTDLKSRMDEREIQRIWLLSMFPPTASKKITRAVERCRNSENRKLWGVTDGEEILAVVEYYIREDNILYICEIAVTEERRGQGIGRLMLVQLQEKYQLPIELETDDDAIGFYRKCGFEGVPFEKYGIQRWKCTLSIK